HRQATDRGSGPPRPNRAPGGPGHRRGPAGLLQPHPRRSESRRLRDRHPADDPPLRDPRHRPARRQARPRDRLSHRQHRHGPLPAPPLRHLRGDRPPARQRRDAERRREPRHPPAVRASAGTARALLLRLLGRPLRPPGRSRPPPLPPAGGEVRQRRSTHPANGTRLRAGAGAAGVRRWGLRFGTAAALILLALTLLNASWLAPEPTGKVKLVAHRGVYQLFDQTNLDPYETCTATRIEQPVHDYLENTVRSMQRA